MSTSPVQLFNGLLNSTSNSDKKHFQSFLPTDAGHQSPTILSCCENVFKRQVQVVTCGRQTDFCFIRTLSATKRKSLSCSLPPCAALLRLMATLSVKPRRGPGLALYLVEKVAFTEIAPQSYLAGKDRGKEIFGAHLASSSGIHQLKVFAQSQLQEAVADKIIFL